MTKNLWSIFGLGLALSATSAFAATVSLAPGAGIPVVPSDGSAFTGTLVTSMSGNLSNGPGESASYTEQVYRQTNGFLTFYYQLTNTSPTDALNEVSLSDFTGVTASVGYLTGNGGTLAPTQTPPGNEASRTASGFEINFFYQKSGTDGQFLPGQTLDYLEIVTNSTSWAPGTVSVIDDGVATTSSLGPVATPEPFSMGLLGGGLALLGVSRIRRSKKS